MKVKNVGRTQRKYSSDYAIFIGNKPSDKRKQESTLSLSTRISRTYDNFFFNLNGMAQAGTAGIYLRASADISRCQPPINKILTSHVEYAGSSPAPSGTHEARRLSQSLAWPPANAGQSSGL